MLELEKGSNKGNWRLLIDGEKRVASIFCPECGKHASLTEHNIDPSGIVSPSVVCPYSCGFHAHVKLLGWDLIQSEVVRNGSETGS